MASIIEAQNLQKYFIESTGRIADLLLRRKRVLKAVDSVDLTVHRNETVGVVGESGCGKSTLGRTLIRLYEPDGGRIIFKYDDITHLKGDELKKYRRFMQIVFQNPYSSLNPRQKIKDIIKRPLDLHGFDDSLNLVYEALENVGLPKDYAERYPHQLSGGERQRVALARAIALKPELVVADEVTSSVDVSIQAQLLKLLKNLQEEFKLSYIFISHDLSVVKTISQRIAVMYLGKVVEEASTEELFANPLHPYTAALFASIPDIDTPWEPQLLKGEASSLYSVARGCRFQPRCPYAKKICSEEEPPFKEYSKNHKAACWLYER
ncbi:MAG: ABC transporter ATP-binding protein [Nitrososphaerales archaeon]